MICTLSREAERQIQLAACTVNKMPAKCGIASTNLLHVDKVLQSLQSCRSPVIPLAFASYSNWQWCFWQQQWQQSKRCSHQRIYTRQTIYQLQQKPIHRQYKINIALCYNGYTGLMACRDQCSTGLPHTYVDEFHTSVCLQPVQRHPQGSFGLKTDPVSPLHS